MDKQKKIIVGLVCAVVLVFGFWFAVNSNNKSKGQGTESVLENEPTIAPVDSSVVVDLTSATKKGEVLIEVKNAPVGTKKAEMELTYNREKRPEDETESDIIPDGVLAGCDFKSGQRSCLKEGITLGTCSSGVCRYHTVVGKIKLSIIFSGSYGERSFEKEYQLK